MLSECLGLQSFTILKANALCFNPMFLYFIGKSAPFLFRHPSYAYVSQNFHLRHDVLYNDKAGYARTMSSRLF